MSKFGHRQRKASLLFSLCCLSTLLSSLLSCSKRYDNLAPFNAIPFSDAYNYSVGRFKTSYLADQIHAYYRGNIRGPIAVATFVELDNLYGSSPFGRLLGEQLMSELAMKGYTVIELRKSDALQIITNEGELALSREMKTLKPVHDISGIVVGTYVESPVRIYVNARLIDPASSVVVSAGSVEMPKTQEIARLLRNSSVPQTLERIPVRHLGYSGFLLPYYGWPYMGPTGKGLPPDLNDPEENYPGEGQPGITDLPEPRTVVPPAPTLEPTT